VDAFITVYGEDLAVIRRTVLAAMAMRGLHQTWLLDDGDSDDVRDLAAELGCGYVRRLGSGGARRRATSTTRSPSPRRTSSASSTRTSSWSRSSSRRPCRIWRFPTSPSCRPRRLTGTFTTSSAAAPATCRACSIGSCSPAGTVQRGLLRRDERALPAVGGHGHRGHVHPVEVRGCVDVAAAS
jgi:hypothetical protein